MPTLKTVPKISTNILHSSEKIVRSNALEDIDHKESISLGRLNKSDIVLDTMLNTQHLHLDGLEVHVGAHSNETITNTRVLEDFASNVGKKSETPSTCLINELVETMPIRVYT